MSEKMTRRKWALGALAGAAGLVGGWWWRTQERTSAPAHAGGLENSDAATALPPGLPSLDGKPLNAADWAGRPLVLNFWAPWCGPCVKEMPELDRFYQAQNGSSSAGPGAQLIGLAVDEEPAVREFLGRHPVGFPIAVLGTNGLDLLRRLSGDPQVVLPFSAVFDRQGRLQHKKFGPLDMAELARWTAPAPTGQTP